MSGVIVLDKNRGRPSIELFLKRLDLSKSREEPLS